MHQPGLGKLGWCWI